MIVIALLTDLGYRTFKAVDAASALTVIDSGIPIDLLFTDVVMPGTLKSPSLQGRRRNGLPISAGRLTVLLVEDDHLMRTTTADILDDAGWLGASLVRAADVIIVRVRNFLVQDR